MCHSSLLFSVVLPIKLQLQQQYMLHETYVINLGPGVTHLTFQNLNGMNIQNIIRIMSKTDIILIEVNFSRGDFKNRQ